MKFLPDRMTFYLTRSDGPLNLGNTELEVSSFKIKKKKKKKKKKKEKEKKHHALSLSKTHQLPTILTTG